MDEQVRFEWNEKEKSHCGMIKKGAEWVFIDPPVKISAEHAAMMFPVGDDGKGFVESLEDAGWEFEKMD